MAPHPYRQAFAERDVDRVVELLADDVVFHSPVISEPAFQGRESVAVLTRVIFDRILDTDYTHEYGDERAHVLIADSRVLGKQVKATTLLEFNAEGKIREIWIMARPLVGATAIVEAIGSGLAEHQKPGRGRIISAVTKPLAGLAAMTDLVGSRVIAALNRTA